jgi:hypothetical protein
MNPCPQGAGMAVEWSVVGDREVGTVFHGNFTRAPMWHKGQNSFPHLWSGKVIQVYRTRLLHWALGIYIRRVVLAIKYKVGGKNLSSQRDSE